MGLTEAHHNNMLRTLYKTKFCFSKLFDYYSCVTILPVLIQTMVVVKQFVEGYSISYHCMSSQFPALHS